MQATAIVPNGRKITPKQGRVSSRLHEACRLIVFEGFTIERAAEVTGYHTGNLASAIRKDHVRALMRDMTEAFMNSATFRARWRLAGLLDAQSEDVRLKAARTILELAGELGGQSSENKGELGAVHLHIHRSGRQSGQLGQLTDTEVETVTIQAIRPGAVNASKVEPPVLDLDPTRTE